MEEFNKLVLSFEVAAERIRKTKHRIQENKTDYPYIENEMDKIYRYLKRIAPKFYNFDHAVFSPLYRTLTDDLLSTETWISPYHFIVDNTPNFVYTPNERTMPNTLNDDKILDYIVFTVWQRYANKNVYGKVKSLEYEAFEAKCSDFSDTVADICEENNISCYIVRINPGFLETARLYNGYKIHDFCIVKLSGGYYLIDPSYRQFFMFRAASLERIGIPFLGGVFPGIFMKMTGERMSVATKLIETGWISFTPDNIKNYFDGFALSYRNGLYYDETKDYSYTTDYTSADYINFLKGEDSQAFREGEIFVSRQKILYKKM